MLKPPGSSSSSTSPSSPSSSSFCSSRSFSSSSSSSFTSPLLFSLHIIIFIFVFATVLQAVEARNPNKVSCRTLDYLKDNYPKELYDACAVYLNRKDLKGRFYVDSNFADNATSIYRALNGIKLLPGKGSRCRDPAFQLYCPLFFLPCKYASLGPTTPWPGVYPVPVLPCRSICENTNEACEEDFGSTGLALNCSIFPESIMEIPSLGFSAPCYNGTQDMHFMDYKCPKPLAYTKDDPKGDCYALYCPDPSYNEAEIDGILWVFRILHLISGCCCLFIIIPYLALPSRRRFPHLQLTQTFISNLFYVIPGIALWYGDWESFICEPDHSVATQENNSACAFFGFWFVWHSLSLAAWWLNLVINLFVGLVFETTIPLWGFCVMFVVAWFGTAIFPIVGISIGHIQSSGTAICFLDIDYTSWLFVVPHTFIFGCALLLLIPIVWKMTKIVHWAALNASTNIKATRLRQHLRILIFAVYYLVAMFTVIVQSWWTHFNKNELLSAYGDYTRCSIEDLGTRDCGNNNRANYGWSIFNYTLAGLGAIVLWLIFGVGQTLTWYWWKLLITRRRWPNPKEVEAATLGSATAGSSGSTSNRGKTGDPSNTSSTTGPSTPATSVNHSNHSPGSSEHSL